MSIEIRKDRPVPKGRKQYPWKDMEVGDTIVTDDNIVPTANRWAGYNEEKLGELRRFTSEKIDDPEDEDFGKYLIGRVR